jgi:hypothetical protein
MDLSSGEAVVRNSLGFRTLIDFFVRDSVKNLIDDKRKSTFTGPVSDVFGYSIKTNLVTPTYA